MECLGDRVKALRVEQNLTQQQLASQLDVAQGHYSKLERGQRKWSTDIIDRLGAIFGRSGLDLVRGTDEHWRYGSRILGVDALNTELLDMSRAQAEGVEAENEARAAAAIMVQQSYHQIAGLFDAVHGGGVYFEFDDLDVIYDKLVEVTRLGIKLLGDQRLAGVFFPMSVYPTPVPPECAGEEWEHEIEPKLTTSRRLVDRVTGPYALSVNPETRKRFESLFLLEDEWIDELRSKRQRLERDFYERVQRVAEEQFRQPESRVRPDNADERVDP
jgi:transcriptional regulator with XRE-family HTH domain